MKFYTDYLWFNTSKHREYINISSEVEEAVRKSEIQEGMVLAGYALSLGRYPMGLVDDDQVEGFGLSGPSDKGLDGSDHDRLIYVHLLGNSGAGQAYGRLGPDRQELLLGLCD